MCVQFLDISSFLVLISLAISMRKNPAAHKRLMILSTVAIAAPGFSRFLRFAYPTVALTPFHFLLTTYYGDILLVALMLGWDLYRGRLIRAHVLASIVMLTCWSLNSFLYFWPPWSNLTLQWVTAWAK
jgi:hypothetical protein